MKKLESLKGISEAQVQDMIASDPDAPEATDGQLARARPFAEALPELAAAMEAGGIVRRPVGRPSGSNKTSVSLRLDSDLIERLKADGPGWQTRANAILRESVGI